MILQERLAKEKPGTMVYLGCAAGSGFLAVDHAEKLLKDLGKIDQNFRHREIKLIAKRSTTISIYPKQLATNAKSLSNAKKMLQELTKRREECLEPEDIKDIESKIKGVSGKIRKYESMPEHLERLKEVAIKDIELRSKRLTGWTMLEYRQVMQEYPHTVEIPGITILIEGDLMGDYWSYKEYKEGRVEQ